MDSEELLVGIINSISDFEIIRDQHWYRIPVDIADKRLKKRWPPKWIAFYHSGALKNNPFLISHYAEIKSMLRYREMNFFQMNRIIKIQIKYIIK